MEIKEIINILVEFRNQRDWEQFHNSKDLAIALNIEAAELLEVFLWKKPEDAEIERIKDELADVFSYAFLLAEKLNLDVKQIILDKIEANKIKYPVDKSKGNAKKYNQF